MMPTSAIHISHSLEHSNIPFAEHVKVVVLYGVYGQNPDMDKIYNWTKFRIGHNPHLDIIQNGQNPERYMVHILSMVHPFLIIHYSDD